ncbi:MAG: DUF2721 domain-containing protein, partial [Chitinophagaceae bacterium]
HNLRVRIRLIRSMQAFGVLSFLMCIICMFSIYQGWSVMSYISFGASLLSFGISLVISLTEIFMSLRALELELSDMEELTRASLFKDILKREGKQAGR